MQGLVSGTHASVAGDGLGMVLGGEAAGAAVLQIDVKGLAAHQTHDLEGEVVLARGVIAACVHKVGMPDPASSCPSQFQAAAEDDGIGAENGVAARVLAEVVLLAEAVLEGVAEIVE